MSPFPHTKIFCIVGPTASGKTALSLILAERLRAEIVSADSRQVYRYMDIGTAKPTAEERERVPHHCIDILDPEESFSAGAFGETARRIVEEIHARERCVIVAGGSGLYVRALLDGMFEGSFRDDALRTSLNREAEEKGLPALFERLVSLDPISAERIHPNDRKRVLRALEVTELAGMPMSRLQEERTYDPGFTVTRIGLRWPREKLYRRIEDRVDAMIRSGLIDEVRHLREMGYSLDHNSMDSVGYKEVFAYFTGETSREEMIDAVKQNTRRFAKKQMTWFRRDERIRWIEMKDTLSWEALADALLDGNTVG